jgi:plastocyanin domain-containing protein
MSIKPNLPTTLNLITKRTQGCSRAISFPTLGIQKVLPETGTTQIELPALASGTVVPYSCSMGMFSGKITVV